MKEDDDMNYVPLRESEATPLPVADAVAWLSRPTQDTDRDFLNAKLIDLLQQGLARAARDGDGRMRFVITQAGLGQVRETLGY